MVHYVDPIVLEINDQGVIMKTMCKKCCRLGLLLCVMLVGNFWTISANDTSQPTVSTELRTMVESDWAFQESQKGRKLSDPAAIADLWRRFQQLQNNLGVHAKSQLNVDLLASTTEQERETLYKTLRWHLRDVALSNPLLSETPLVFMKRNRFVCQMLHEYVGYYYKYTGTSGGEVCILAKPGYSLETRSLTNDKLPAGAFTTLAISNDAKTLYFAHADFDLAADSPRNVTWSQLGSHDFQSKTFDYLDGNEGKFCIWSMSIDGSNLRRLTDGRYDDFDPCELPDGGIAFLSTRRGGFIRCNNPWEPLPVYTLHRMNADGKNIRTLSFHETNEWHPVVLNDGRIVYSRWDYVDRSAAHYHGLWTSNPDGTQPAVVFGNYTQMVSACYQPRAVPGSQKIMFVAGAHHANTGGSLAMFDPALTNYDIDTAEDRLDLLERITPEVEFPETPNQWPSTYYHSPWPLSENYYFVSYSREPLGCFGAGSDVTGRTGIYYLDRFGNLELLYEDADISCQYPIPIQPRSVAPVIPDRRDESLGNYGEFYLSDVRNSLVPMDRDRKIVELRVFELLPKWPDWTANSPRLGHANAEGARLLLGTVPVAEDGSAYFRVPADKPVYFQAIDSEGKAVQTMRSSVYLQSGERRSCVGCHEPLHATPDSFMPARELLKLAEGPDGTKPLSYARLVQPIFDQRCASCHDGESASDKGKTDLRGIPRDDFSVSYQSLRPYLRWYEWGDNSIQQTTTLPGRCGADESPLTAILADENHGERIALRNDELRKIYLWLDANAVFYGVYTDAEREQQRQGKTVAMPDDVLWRGNN